jgi:general nucleoside transport system permease protein
MAASGDLAQRDKTLMGWPFLSLVLSKATPLLLASLGGLISELSGVINFALEGMMLAGAFGAMWATFAFQSPWAGLVGGMVGGVIIAVCHGAASLKLRANQIVSAIALNLFAAGATGMLLNQVFGVYGTSPTVKRLPDLEQFFSTVIPQQIGGLAPFWGRLSVLVPVALILGLAVLGAFRWTPWGLRLRACGENPTAAAAAGIAVVPTRFLAVCASGVLAGLGGAYLAIGELSQFVEGITQGRGYLAIAALILGRWRPLGVLWAALFFGLSQAASEWLAVQWSTLPSQVFLALPYGICLAILIVQFGRRQPPSALGQL